MQLKQQFDVDDLFRLAEVLRHAVDELDMDLVIRAREDADAKQQLGRQIMTALFHVAPTSGRAFLAGLCDLTSEEVGKQPATELLDVIEALIERDDLRDFFTRAVDLLEKLAPGSAASIKSATEPSSGPSVVTDTARAS